MNKKKFLINDVIVAEYIDSFFGRAKGLMFKNKGNLLMDFKKECKPGIWMLFMRYPLDLFFLNENFEVVDVAKNCLPMSVNPSTWKVYCPKKKCRYVLEVESGLLNLKIGEKIKLKTLVEQDIKQNSHSNK